jgi:pimeloyl-ACP methyl ester carboxylesterase
MKFSVDGREVYAYTGGRPLAADQPLLVLLHGAQHDHSAWIMQSRYLAHHGWSVLAADLPGHGRSAGPALASVEAIAKWIRTAVPEACESAGLATVPSTVVGGHSMGSLVALEVGADPPEWLAGTLLAATAVPMRVSDALLAAAREDEARAFDMINFWSSNGINHRPGTPSPGFSTFLLNRRLMERQAPGVLYTDFAACNAYAAGPARAGALKHPVLFLLAARDQMTPPRAARDAIAAARGAGIPVSVATVPEAGHNLLAECPEETLAAMRDWLATLAHAPGAS